MNCLGLDCAVFEDAGLCAVDCCFDVDMGL